MGGAESMLMVLVVLLAAAVGGLGLVLLRKATEAESQHRSFSLGLLWLLVRHRPVWAAGILCVIGEFVLQAIALANGPISSVQLLIVMELPFTLILSQLILGGRLRVREWSAISAMTAGLIVLLLTLSPRGGDPESARLLTWLIGLAVTVGAIALVLVAGRWTGTGARTALAGIAAGMAAGLIAVLVTAATSALERGLDAALATWQTWTLLAVGAAAFFLLQNAMQSGRLVASQPGTTLANPLVASLWGVVLLHEHVRTGWWLLGAAFGAALLIGGVLLLSRSPLLDGDTEGADTPAPATQPAD